MTGPRSESFSLRLIRRLPGSHMGKLYVLGGRERRPGISEPTPKDEWYLYEAALILEVDTSSGTVRTCVEYQSPPEARAGRHRAAHFHAGAVVGNTLYTCTSTEVLIYQIPDFKQIGYISLPCFNDVHHVTPASDGNLLVVSTGLEMVVKISPRGEILAEWSVLGGDPWTRFSRAIDYRKVESTKPHVAHPNFAFELAGEVWVTRFHQHDAISLNGSARQITIADEGVHDGAAWGAHLLFTVVDGKIVAVNRSSLQIEQVIDLRQIQDRDQRVLPAWCRGILPIDDRRIWVGFTRIRQTIFRENVRWVKTVLREGTLVRPTHIALFDIVNKVCVQEFDLEPHGMNAVYGIYPAPN
jgi:hypothetical protein